MILVADAGPLRYLVLMGHVELLKSLCGRAAVPFAVTVELQHASTPQAVRTWMTELPDWCTIYADPPSLPGLQHLGRGEQSAISLAISIRADVLLLDDAVARAEAVSRQVSVLGTLGVLAEAHRHQLLDFETALTRLRQTNFYLSEELLNTVRRRLSGAGDSQARAQTSDG